MVPSKNDVDTLPAKPPRESFQDFINASSHANDLEDVKLATAQSVESVAGGGHDSYLYRWIANTLITVTPRLEQMGLALPEGVTADKTLARRLEDEVVAAGSQILGPLQFGAWTRKCPCS